MPRFEVQPTWLIVATALLTLWLALRFRASRRNAHLPPLVKGYPIIGSLVDMATAGKAGTLHLTMQKWAKQYGPVYRVKVGFSEEYFINTDVAVKSLMDTGATYSSERPRWIFSNEFVCNQRNVLLLPASHARWKNQRKVITNQMTSPMMADSALPLNYFETARFLQRIAADPSASSDSRMIWKKLKRYQYSLFTMQTFGFPIEKDDDPVIDYIFSTGLKQIQGTLPGERIIELFPFLGYLPMALKPWEKEGRQTYAEDLAWCRERMKRCRQAMKEGVALPSAALARLLADPKLAGLEDDDEACYLMLMLTIGAADTSMMTTWSFMEAMMSYPAVQKKAQAEIDAACPDRLPRWEDLDNLPYVRCVMKEVWRWRPPVALGHPHLTTKDIIYENMVIPKGAYLHLNAWAIQHDPARHENPDDFVPERYTDDLTTSQQSINSKDVTKRDHFAFGAGRRICPGYHVAERSFAITLMRMLWCFDITAKKGTGLPLKNDTFDGPMPATRGLSMPVELKVRDSFRQKVIDEEYAQECAAYADVLKLGTL